MRQALKELVSSAITVEYYLPNGEYKINSSSYSNKKDVCFKGKSDEFIANIIYNGIVEYAIGEYEIDYENISEEQLRALAEYTRYDEEDSHTTKLRYGFYGEVILYAILYSKFKADVLISKGYFYDPLENGEAKGYDAYHLIQNDNSVELWFGEAKFRNGIKSSIEEVISKLDKAISENYFKKNIIAISKKKFNISNGQITIDRLKPITESWREKVSIVIEDELKNNNITLVYPILIAYQQKKLSDYNDGIKECIDYIKTLFESGKYKFVNSLNAKIFFMFLPVDNVKQIKESVLEWISTKKPLI